MRIHRGIPVNSIWTNLCNKQYTIHKYNYTTRRKHKHKRNTLSQHTYGICFDIDGVLLRGKQPIPGASTTIEQLLLTHAIQSTELPIPFILLTNGGGVTETVKAQQINERLLSHSLVKLNASHIVQSHTPMQSLVQQYDNKNVLCIGTGELRDVMQNYGFNNVITADQIAAVNLHALPHLSNELALHDKTEHSTPLTTIPDIAAILVLHDPVVWDRDMQIILDVLLYNNKHSDAQIPLYFSNPDIVFSGHYHAPRLAQGSFRLALQSIYEQISGKKLHYTLFGKPEQTQFDYAYKKLNQHAQTLNYAGIHRAYMIGDNVHADIAGANQSYHPFTSIFVNSGTLKLSGTNDPLLTPKHICEDVTEAVELIKSIESKQST